MKKNLIQTLIDIIYYLILCTSTFLMLKMIIGYSSFDTKYEFLSQKQDYLHIKPWLYAFYIHVFFSLFTLIAGFTQFSEHDFGIITIAFSFDFKLFVSFLIIHY